MLHTAACMPIVHGRSLRMHGMRTRLFGASTASDRSTPAAFLAIAGLRTSHSASSARSPPSSSSRHLPGAGLCACWCICGGRGRVAVGWGRVGLGWCRVVWRTGPRSELDRQIAESAGGLHEKAEKAHR